MNQTNTSLNSRENYQFRMEKAIQYMEQHLSDDVNLEAAAREAGFSPFHFHRIFSGITGETPQNFITRLRMERAANILVKSPAMSITEIAFSCGYASASAFARSFKRYYGIPAGQYARECGKSDRPATWVTAKPATGSTVFHLPDIHIQQKPALHLAMFKSTGGYAPEAVKEVWMKMFQWAESRRLDMSSTRLIAISYDDPQITRMEKCRYYACLTVPETMKRDSRAGILDIPEHLCAVCRLECDADEIIPAYRAFYRDWLPDSGFLMTDLPPYEVYFNAPDVDPASKYVFDLCVPVQAL